MKTWLGSSDPTVCICCGDALPGTFVDFCTPVGWGPACATCWGVYGQGVGQVYEQNDNGAWQHSHAVRRMPCNATPSH